MSIYMEMISAMQKYGISYFDHGTLKNGRKKVGDWYKTDRLTDAQAQAMRDAGAQVLSSSPMYAPEIVQAVILFPKGWKA